MHIIYIHQYFTLPSNAGGTRSYDLATRFVEAGHKVTMITSSAYLKNFAPYTQKWTVKECNGINVHILDLHYDQKQNFKQRVKAFMGFMYEASKYVAKLDADVVLATSTPLTIAVPALYKAMRHKKPFIFEVRDVWPEAPVAIGALKNKAVISLLEKFEQHTYRKSKHVVALSDDMKTSILRNTDTPTDKVTVIPNISELRRFENFEPGKEFIKSLIGFQPKKSLLYAGTLGSANGLKFMIDIAIRAQSIDEDIMFLLLGDGNEKAGLKQYAAEKGVLGKNLFFLDPIPKAMLPQLYSEVTVASSFYVPIKELWANSANKFFDCLAAGRPVLVNYEGWQANVIRERNMGFVFDYREENIGKEAMRFGKYINDTTLLELHGKNARQVAAEKYSLDVAAQQYLKILEHVV
ncbi:glycosyltransferase family 4 protein [Taibaiella soli]|uniref:Glycosyltransferase WbuB n=1 Tax=Taibaiella soli TaxID=1649169 RepID=A0A2W2B1B3_9BACT|nr:glycosyltransferase family 4 protein [Taibaiella soli]PZF74034.1 glycosyltransferase WbuB [Taibaiella soli]